MRGKISGYELTNQRTGKARKVPLYIGRFLRVIDAWDYLNDTAFDGEMTRPKIKVWQQLVCQYKGKKQKLAGAYDHEKKCIWICWGIPDQLETMYHEMVHQYLAEVFGETAIEHGQLFWSTYAEHLERLM